MFTGIVAAMGTVTAVIPEHSPGITRLCIDPAGLTDDLELGGSLAVNGVCLTALADPDHPEGFAADVMGETIERTSLGTLSVGDVVNLERCTPAGGRFDGHVVQGHVDAAGTVALIDPQGSWTRMRITVPDRLASQLAEKGSVTVDGVSLTITAVSEPGEPAWFEIGLIPVTLATTRLGRVGVGDRVNIETDVLAKYVERIMAVRAAG